MCLRGLPRILVGEDHQNSEAKLGVSAAPFADDLLASRPQYTVSHTHTLNYTLTASSFPKGPRYCYGEYFSKSFFVIPNIETLHSTI